MPQPMGVNDAKRSAEMKRTAKVIVSATGKEGIPPPSGEILELRDSELLCRDDSDGEHENNSVY